MKNALYALVILSIALCGCSSPAPVPADVTTAAPLNPPATLTLDTAAPAPSSTPRWTMAPQFPPTVAPTLAGSLDVPQPTATVPAAQAPTLAPAQATAAPDPMLPTATPLPEGLPRPGLWHGVGGDERFSFDFIVMYINKRPVFMLTSGEWSREDDPNSLVFGFPASPVFDGSEFEMNVNIRIRGVTLSPEVMEGVLIYIVDRKTQRSYEMQWTGTFVSELPAAPAVTP